MSEIIYTLRKKFNRKEYMKEYCKSNKWKKYHQEWYKKNKSEILRKAKLRRLKKNEIVKNFINNNI